MKHECGKGTSINKANNDIVRWCEMCNEWVVERDGKGIQVLFCPFCGEKLEKPLVQGSAYLIEKENEPGVRLVATSMGNGWLIPGERIVVCGFKVLRGPLDMDRYNEFPVKGE